MEDEPLRLLAAELLEMLQGRLNAWPPKEVIQLTREEALRIIAYIEAI